MACRLRCFTDTHIARAVAIQLRQREVDVLRCEDVGMESADDPELLAYATEHERTMISCDRDFEAIHFQWLAEERSHYGMILMDQLEHCQQIGRIVKIILSVCDMLDQRDGLIGRLE